MLEAPEGPGDADRVIIRPADDMMKDDDVHASRRRFLSKGALLSAGAVCAGRLEAAMPDPFDPRSIAEIASCFQPVLQIPGHYINDHCIVRDDVGLYHVFYILGEVGKGCYTPGNEVIIGHAVSKNLLQWEVQPHALECLSGGPYWESAHIFAPYVVRHAGLYWMFYSGDTPGRGQRIGLATSRDLSRWERHPNNPLITPQGSWALWHAEKPTSCRDAHVWREPEGTFYMLWVADMREPPRTSCLALSRSRNLVEWEELGPVLVRRWSDLESITMKTESPCMVRRRDRYFLFYRHGNGMKYSISDVPTGWEGRDTYYLGPSHASEIFETGGQWYITSCSRPVDDIAHKRDRSMGLFLARLDWDRFLPRIVSL